MDIREDKSPILLKDLGMRFPTEMSKRKYRYGLYKCGYCGKEWETQTSDIKNGHTKSCGCILITHNLRHHRMYGTWKGMSDRCYNQKHDAYKNYGGRGITVCAEWRDSLEQFIEDMFPSFVEGLTLDRIDNDKGYSKENCRWATRSEQCINQRTRKDNSTGFVGVTYHTRDLLFTASICINKKRKHIGYYQTLIEAAIARNNYIIENGLPHKLSIISNEDIEVVDGD